MSAPNSTTSNADVTLTLPQNDGDSGNFLRTDGSGTLTWATPTDTTTNLTRSTYVAANSQTAIDFTDVPDNARKVSIIFQSLSFPVTIRQCLALGPHMLTVLGFRRCFHNHLYKNQWNHQSLQANYRFQKNLKIEK